MKKTIFCGMMAIALVSCSNDELISEQSDSSSIKYTVHCQTASRAADIYCANNLMDAFKVSAKKGDATFFDGDDVTHTGTTWTNSTKRYWPADGSLDFFAYANDNGTFILNGDNGPSFVDYQVNSDVANQSDLVYAFTTDQTKSANQTVNLNFRHALSQIVFRAKNVNPNLYVEVTGVTVVNVNGKGTYTFPSESTTTNVAHGTSSGTVPTAQGTWDSANFSEIGSYSTTFDTVPVICVKGDTENTSDVVNLTEYTASTDGVHGDELPTEGNNPFGTALLLLPQTIEKAEFVQGSGQLPETGVYFKVTCKLWNIATPGTDGNKTDSDILLYPAVTTGETEASTAAGDVLIPVSIDWQQGMKYVYTFVFGEGNGGWDPNGPDPVFVPITFDVSVDEFIPVTNQDIDLDTELAK